MCKQAGRTYCDELGEDVSLWSKDCPLPKPTWINESHKVFLEAIKLSEEGNAHKARMLLEASSDLKMRAWFDDHAQNTGEWRTKSFRVPAPKAALPLDTEKTFAKFEVKLFARDDFRCRYCASPVIPKKVFKKLQALVGDNALPLGRTNKTRSGFYLIFAATLDHVLPWSLGGRTDESNLVTCCWSCNYGKANYTVEQLGIRIPIHHS